MEPTSTLLPANLDEGEFAFYQGKAYRLEEVGDRWDFSRAIELGPTKAAECTATKTGRKSGDSTRSTWGWPEPNHRGEEWVAYAGWRLHPRGPCDQCLRDELVCELGTDKLCASCSTRKTICSINKWHTTRGASKKVVSSIEVDSSISEEESDDEPPVSKASNFAPSGGPSAGSKRQLVKSSSRVVKRRRVESPEEDEVAPSVRNNSNNNNKGKGRSGSSGDAARLRLLRDECELLTRRLSFIQNEIEYFASKFEESM